MPVGIMGQGSRPEAEAHVRAQHVATERKLAISFELGGLPVVTHTVRVATDLQRGDQAAEGVLALYAQPENGAGHLGLAGGVNVASDEPPDLGQRDDLHRTHVAVEERDLDVAQYN